MDGKQYCIPRGGKPTKCLVGNGPADGFVWVCDGEICPRGQPRAGCPPYPITGCHPTVFGNTICIDPEPSPTISCTISNNQIAVGETTVFTAVQVGPAIPVDFVFDHGDGTLDPRPRSEAYYASPGSYVVRLRWNHAGGSGVSDCGTVTVT